MKDNLFTKLVNFYNVNDENFKEFMSELYKRLLENNRDVKYVKDHLSDEIEKLLEKYLVDGKFNINIKEKVEEYLINNTELEDINKGLNSKADIVETQKLQSQLNNLVLGAVGDGNNAEVVSARGGFSLLNNRLDDIDTRTDSLVNIRNTFSDQSIRTKSWSVANGDYTLGYGSNFSNAMTIENRDKNILLYKDVPITKNAVGPPKL